MRRMLTAIPQSFNYTDTDNTLIWEILNKTDRKTQAKLCGNLKLVNVVGHNALVTVFIFYFTQVLISDKSGTNT